MGHEVIPFFLWIFRVAGCQSSKEVILPSLDVAFVCITDMVVCWNQMEIDIVFLEYRFEYVRVFVVNDGEIGGVSIITEAV